MRTASSGSRISIISTIFILAAGVGCGASEPIDPLDRDLLRKLARARGEPSDSARSGSFSIDFTTDSCDCPNLDIAGQPVDICTIGAISGLPIELLESSGVLAISAGSSVMMLNGAIEADDSFIVAETRDLTTFTGPFLLLRRLDGEFTNQDTAAGWAGQRVLGVYASENVDCRWIGSFVLTRN